MMNIETLTAFLGWCTVINIGVLIFTTIILVILREPITNIHSKLFGLNPANLPHEYFHYLGNYKIAVLIFNVVPYIALKVIA